MYLKRSIDNILDWLIYMLYVFVEKLKNWSFFEHYPFYVLFDLLDCQIHYDCTFLYKKKCLSLNIFIQLLTDVLYVQFIIWQGKDKGEGYLYDCDLLQLFELGSVTHHYYLVNLRLPVNFLKGYNVGIGRVVDIYIHVS